MTSTVHITILDQDSPNDPERSDQALAEFIARPFHDLPPAVWLEPDPALRPAVLMADFARWIGHSRRHGEIHVATVDGQLAGVAVWLDVASPASAEPALDTTGLSPAAVQRLTDFGATLGAHHFTGPQRYLALFAVHPDRQRDGVGTALLDLGHATLDARDHTAHLHAGSPGAVAFYAHSNWRTSPPFSLPDGGPPMWPMIRPPARTNEPTVPS